MPDKIIQLMIGQKININYTFAVVLSCDIRSIDIYAMQGFTKKDDYVFCGLREIKIFLFDPCQSFSFICLLQGCSQLFEVLNDGVRCNDIDQKSSLCNS